MAATRNDCFGSISYSLPELLLHLLHLSHPFNASVLRALLCACFPESTTPGFSRPPQLPAELCPITSGPSNPSSHLPAQPWAYPCQMGTQMGDYSTLLCHIWFPSKAGHKATRIKRWGDEVWMWGSAHAKSELVQSIFLGLCLHHSPVITLRLFPRS